MCSCPGVVGVTLGGGIGRYSGRFGLVINALLSVRLVTADGRLLTVSESSHPDLFWGIRGAGGNFGVITSATYKLQRIASGADHGQGHVLMADMVIPAAQTAEYFRILEWFNDSMPANLAIYSMIMYSDAANDVSPSALPPPLSVKQAAYSYPELHLTSNQGRGHGQLGLYGPRVGSTRSDATSTRPTAVPFVGEDGALVQDNPK